MFLARDPALSVVEGVEFRFENIRSVGYHIAKKDRRDLIPTKPNTVNVKFRCHDAVLNTAGSILYCMFDALSNSAKQLKEDKGIFRGPRPGVFHKVEPSLTSSLVHDSNVSRWKRTLDYPLVYGIRSAKGLEFKIVIQ